jgi:hypothetical protein
MALARGATTPGSGARASPAYDLEMQGLAQRCLVPALTMTRFAGDEELGGEILAAMSHHGVHFAQPEHAIDIGSCRAKGLVPRLRTTGPRLREWPRGSVCHAHALAFSNLTEVVS